jgi:hypothetical protein
VGWRTEGLNPSRSNRFFLSLKHGAISDAHPVSYSLDVRVHSWDYSRQGMMLTTHLPLVRLKMSGAAPLHPYMPSRHRQGQCYLYREQSTFNLPSSAELPSEQLKSSS